MGILELPDFNAEVLVEGYFWKDGIISFERKLVSERARKLDGKILSLVAANTSYELHASRSAEIHRTDPYQRATWAQ